MKKIVLMRHSYAENNSSNTLDADRNLTEQGIQVIKGQAAKLQQVAMIPDCIVSSHAKRAYQTATLIAGYLDFTPPIAIAPFLYGDFTTEDFIDYVRNMPDSCKILMVISHNPNLTYLFHGLLNSHNYSFSPASIAIINPGIEKWNLIDVGKSKLEQFFIPK